MSCTVTTMSCSWYGCNRAARRAVALPGGVAAGIHYVNAVAAGGRPCGISAPAAWSAARVGGMSALVDLSVLVLISLHVHASRWLCPMVAFMSSWYRF